jgi:ubiquitin C-terminal hydrolase
MARRNCREEWFYFNDSVVKRIEEGDVIGRDPYILVYARERNS